LTIRKTHGATILLASHNMLESSGWCDRRHHHEARRIEDDDSPTRSCCATTGDAGEVFLDVARGRVQENTP